MIKVAFLRKLLFLVAAIFVFSGGFAYQSFHRNNKDQAEDPGFKNVILIGWDGVQRNHLMELLEEERLPHLKQLSQEGSLIPIDITTGATETKSGWVQILTGYDPQISGVYSNREYGPVPKGYTLPERLEDYFGDSNINTVFLAGKDHNLGTRGPHRICTNCNRLYWFDEELSTHPDGADKKELKQMEGEPYFISKNYIDFFENGLLTADVVGPKVLEYIEKFRGDNMFMFVQFREPDQPGGHLHGENSSEYTEGIILDDRWLGEIVKKLKELGIYEETLIYVTSDHGFDEGDNEHFDAPYVFLATNDPRVQAAKGDRKDITPTILDRYGVNINSLEPPIDGASLLDNALQPVRIGYFHGGRTHMMYRAYINKYFEEDKVDVNFFTKATNRDELFQVPKSHEAMREKHGEIPFFGRMTGIEIVEEIEKGNLDGGTIGEASFLAALDRGVPIVAVANLGHDTREKPGHGFVLRKGLAINSPEDFKGLTFNSRRSGPVDAMLTREFFASEGVDLDDVTIIDNVPSDKLWESLADGKVDGGYYHYHWMIRFVKGDIGYVYRKLDWINPEASLAVLVFHVDYLEKHRDEVQKIVNAYVRRVKFEKSLSEEERMKPTEFGLQMVNYDLEGMNIPQYDLPPTLQLDFLVEIRDLLLKYDVIQNNIDIEKYLDYSFVEEAMK